MIRKKPACSDFIIEAARALRRNPANIGPKIAAGVQIATIFELSCEEYSPNEFRSGLETVIKKDSVIVVAKMFIVDKSDGSTRRRYGLGRTLRVTSLPPDSVFGLHQWHLNERWQPTNRDKAKRYRVFSQIRLYVKADGLPQLVADIDKGIRRRHVSAEQVIAGMKKTG